MLNNMAHCLMRGGGTADWSYPFVNSFKKVIVLDISKEALKRIPEKEILKIRGSVTKIPLESNSVDCILLIDVFEHIYEKDLPTMIGELNRVLKNGGTIIIFTTHWGWGLNLTINRILGRLNGRFFMGEDQSSGHVNRLKFNEMKKLFNESDLKIKDYRYYNHLFQPLTDYSKDSLAKILDRVRKAKKVRKGQGIKDALNQKRVLPNSIKIPCFIGSYISYLDVLLFGKIIPGDSIFLKIEKP